MKVLIAGEYPFNEVFGQMCADAGHDASVYLIEDFYDAIESGYIMDAIAAADVAVEIHNESAEAKQELLVSMGNALKPNTLLLTSALPTSTTQAASWVPYQQRVVGFSFMPPVSEKSVIEIAAGLNTDPKFVAAAETFMKSLNANVVQVKDSAGLVQARLIGGLLNEAIGILQEGLATAEEIDAMMSLTGDDGMGPLRWADYIGLDAVLGIMRGLYNEWQEDRYRPTPLLKRMVAAGRLGQKIGTGFYTYK